ncbi:MAG: hypothetical protein NXI04_21150 [Planctomycetaceae bacterium]|nr:hypothetical protein [Planctomycetaceae bacterium]
MSRTIGEYWHLHFPDCPPVAHLLRDAYPTRWVRFHSLPASKRYADTDEERQTILDRHNQALSELATPHETLCLLSTGYSETQVPVRDPLWSESDPTAEHWQSFIIEDSDTVDGESPVDESGHTQPPNFWHVFAAEYEWRPHVFDAVLRLVAEDIVRNVLIVSETGHWIYHPYDGGADLILQTTTQRDQLRARFRDWLSARPDGL